ncbi:MAG TPA: hypothetical protein VGU44_03460 [Gammaproteobacteria bacterium]|nr:hypothetical protein [Gammaproteobacteria bacterium]
MLSRATYFLPAENDSDQMVCFYIQHEGYPEGAADYFYKMHHCKNTKGGMAGRFFRANLNAEFSPYHGSHGDTEFRYTINIEGELRVFEKGTIGNQWDVFYEGAWHHFVNQYLEESEHLHLFRLFKNLQHETIMTIQEAEKWVRAFKHRASKCDYVREGVQAIQAQIDVIVAAQKTHGSDMNNGKSGVA